MRYLQRLAVPIYLTALILVSFPLLETLLSVWPLEPFLVRWRYGALGIGSRAIMTPLLGLVLLLVTATLLEHRRILAGFSVLAGVGGVLLLLGVPLFVLDALQMRSSARPEALLTFDIAAAVAVLKVLFAAAVLASMLVAASKAPGKAAASSKGRTSKAPVVGDS